MAPKTLTAGAEQRPPGFKRPQVAVACARCRRHKVKCDGLRPACARCVDLEINCDYVSSNKRKHGDSNEAVQLVGLINSVSQVHAHEIIDYLRQDEDVTSTLRFARTFPIETYRRGNVASGPLTSVPSGVDSSNTTAALDLDRGLDKRDNGMPPGWHRGRGHFTETLPPLRILLASIGAMDDQEPERCTRLRRSPSAPDLQPGIPHPVMRTASPRIWRYDSRLDYATAQDWGVKYVDDQGFRNIISSYLVWDHQSGRPFDEDDFLDGLRYGRTESCSRCLVHTVLAYGSLNYVHVDPMVATTVHQAAWLEAEKLWNEATHEKIADAAAGMLIWALHSYNGTDKLGLKYLLQTRHTGTNLGLYDRNLVSLVYDLSHPRKSRARAIHAWGIYNWVTMAEFAFLSDLGLPNPPPVPMPRLTSSPSTDCWMAWPWPRVTMTVPNLVNETAAARSSLSPILKDIVPLRRKHINAPLTMSFLTAAVDIYRRLCTWWKSIYPALRSPDVLEEAPPHVFMVALLYNFAIQEIFRPFTMTPSIPAPHPAPLQDASLPIEPATSAASSAAMLQRGLLRRVNQLYGYDQVMGFFIFFTWPVAYETLLSTTPQSPSFSVDAKETFLAALSIIRHSGKQYPVMRHAALGIQQTAAKISAALPEEAEEIFADIKKLIATNKDQGTVRSDWVVVFNTSGTDVQGSRLHNLVKELDRLQILDSAEK